MASLKTEKIRTLAVIGSGAVGKTSLIDSILFKTGVNTRRGKVTDGSSLSDHTPEEKEVGHSLTLKVFHAEHAGNTLILLDTPGYGDYVGEAMSALAAVDAAVLVVDGTRAFTVNARKLYHAARDLGVSVFVVVNKLDGDQADFLGAVQNCKTLFGPECAQSFVPDGVGSAFTKVTALLGPDGPSMQDERGPLIESLVETDEAVMERYLEEGEIADDEVQKLYRSAVHSGAIVPVLCCSVETDTGVNQVLDHVTEYAPAPGEARGRTGHKGLPEGEEIQVTASSPNACAQVFKTVTDPYVGKLSFIRVWSGEVRADHPLHLQRTSKPEKLSNLLRVQGKEHDAVDSAVAGEILAVAKVEVLETSDTLCTEADSTFLDAVQVPAPMVSLAVEPKNRADEQKLTGGMRKLAAEDLTFNVERNPVTHELVITGITNLHLDTMIKRLKERFGVEITSRPPRVALKETCLAAAEGHHRHKKQTGGSGQFGEVYLKIEPTERGSGFEFVDEVVGGSIPRNFLPAVEKGITASLSEGVYAGYPVEDVRVRVYDGKHHPVDSNETSFKSAGAKAFKDAFLKAKPTLLEPVVDLVIEAPASAMGDITGDLNSRRGRISGIDPMGDLQIIRAEVPLKEILTYSADLRSMTAGEGSYSYTFSHYDVLPHRLAEEIRAAYEKKE